MIWDWLGFKQLRVPTVRASSSESVHFVSYEPSSSRVFIIILSKVSGSGFSPYWSWFVKVYDFRSSGFRVSVHQDLGFSLALFEVNLTSLVTTDCCSAAYGWKSWFTHTITLSAACTLLGSWPPQLLTAQLVASNLVRDVASPLNFRKRKGKHYTDTKVHSWSWKYMLNSPFSLVLFRSQLSVCRLPSVQRFFWSEFQKGELNSKNI